MSETSVREDPELSPGEKETSLWFAKDESVVHVYTEESSWINRLLHHSHFDEQSRRTVGDDVVAVKGSIPVACLSVKAEPRQSGSHADIISGGVFEDE